MAGGLNKKFLADPVGFLGKHLISVNDTALTTGLARVGFEANQERILLKPFLGAPGKHQHPFECYFLKALPDHQNPGLGFAATTAIYCFTSTLSGCQFLAHGASKQALTIEHNNDLSGNGTYVRYANNAALSTVSAQIHNGGMYDIGVDDVGNVVGIRGANGWDFHFQKIAIDPASKKKKITVTQVV